MGNPYKEESTQNTLSENTEARRAVIIWLFTCTFVLALGLTMYMVHIGNSVPDTETPELMLPVVIIAGIMGSFASALQRTQLPEAQFNIDARNDTPMRIGLYNFVFASIPPLIGAITATIIYLIFAGELLSGAVFPAFECKSVKYPCKEFADFQKYYKPKEGPDIAKAIVWGFMAGFSERLVPNFLNRIAVKSK